MSDLDTEELALDPVDAATSPQADPNAATASSIQVDGVIMDDEGHEWAIPAEDTEEFDADADGPFGRLKLDERFFYQTCRLDEVAAKVSEGFVAVTRREVGLADLKTLEREFGMAEATYVRLKDAVLIKIPKVMADRRQARKARIAKQAVEQTEPTEEMLARGTRPGAPVMKRTRDLDASMGRDKLPFERDIQRRKVASLEE